MLHPKSESDISSLAPSSPSRSPKRAIYYVQSPSHDGDKSSRSMQAITPNYNSPVESPSHHSFGRHSRNSSVSRFSGIFRTSSSGRKFNSGRKRTMNEKGWPECNVIMEEGKYEEFNDDKACTRRCQGIMAFLCFFALFTVFCLVIWGAGRPYKPQVSVKSLVVNNIYAGEGSDSTGVLTKMMTMNGTLKISIYNPATFFGIHVGSSPVNLLFSDITVATGQVKKYFQPRKSRRIVNINVEGIKVPLYGAGSSLPSSTNGIQVSLRLEFEVRTRGNVVGKLVTINQKRKVSCPVVDIDSTTNKPIEFKNKINACSYA